MWREGGGWALHQCASFWGRKECLQKQSSGSSVLPRIMDEPMRQVGGPCLPAQPSPSDSRLTKERSCLDLPPPSPLRPLPCLLAYGMHHGSHYVMLRLVRRSACVRACVMNASMQPSPTCCDGFDLNACAPVHMSVSYTNLTLPTIFRRCMLLALLLTTYRLLTSYRSWDRSIAQT